MVRVNGKSSVSFFLNQVFAFFVCLFCFFSLKIWYHQKCLCIGEIPVGRYVLKPNELGLNFVRRIVRYFMRNIY